MREIIAIVRRNRAAATKAELARIGCEGYSQVTVLGRGRQRGLRDQDSDAGLRFLPKVMFDLVVDDARATETVEAIIRANQTGEFGDGRIFVADVEQGHRISTGGQESVMEIAT